MKRKNFFRLSLLVPYLVLAVTAVISLSSLATVSVDTWLINVTTVFTFSAIFWAPLYTWMTVVLWLWSIGKSEAEIYRVYALSPFILASAMGIPVTLFSMPEGGIMIVWGILHTLHFDNLARYLFPDFNGEYMVGLAGLIVVMGGISVLIGYLFVGLMVWIDRVLQKRKLLVMESE